MRLRDGSDNGTASNFNQILVKCGTEALAMIRQALVEALISRTRKVKIHRDGKKESDAKSKIKSMLTIFFNIKGIFHKEFDLAGQTVNSAYCCYALPRQREKCAKISSTTLATKELAVVSQRIVSRFLFHQGIFYRKQHHCRPHQL
jgi:hypothetical protein